MSLRDAHRAACAEWGEKPDGPIARLIGRIRFAHRDIPAYIRALLRLR